LGIDLPRTFQTSRDGRFTLNHEGAVEIGSIFLRADGGYPAQDDRGQVAQVSFRETSGHIMATVHIHTRLKGDEERLSLNDMGS